MRKLKKLVAKLERKLEKHLARGRVRKAEALRHELRLAHFALGLA